MTAVVVLGCHRSGTSLVASLLDALGVHMGDEMLPAMDSNPLGHYEDLDFFHLNRALLAEFAGCNWKRPPSAGAIRAEASIPRDEVTKLLHEKAKRRLWGWKDPRTSLTIPFYHPHLKDPRYVVVTRDLPDIAASLAKRNGGEPEDWHGLIRLYWARITEFLRSVDAPVLRMRYEDLTHPLTSGGELFRLVEFLDLDHDAQFLRALDRIEHRDRWGFGSIGVGVPYFRPIGDFFWSWTEFLVYGGLQSGDCVLDYPVNLKRGARLPLAHNAIIRSFLESGRDTLCIIEDDHAFNVDQLRRMRSKLENQAFDIVCAEYTKRGDALTPMGWFMPDGADDDMLKAEFFWDVPSTGTQEVDGAAFGFVLIRRWVLEAILDDAPIERFQWAECVGEATPDVPFYYKARRVGAAVGVDRDNRIGHVGTKVYTRGDYDNWLGRAKARAAEKAAEA